MVAGILKTSARTRVRSKGVRGANINLGGEGCELGLARGRPVRWRRKWGGGRGSTDVTRLNKGVGRVRLGLSYL